MSNRVAKLPLGSLKVRENNSCYRNHLFQAIIAHSSSNAFLLLFIWVTEASIPASWRQLNSIVSFALEFLRKTIKYAITGQAIFDEVFMFVVVPVIHDIKNWFQKFVEFAPPTSILFCKLIVPHYGLFLNIPLYKILRGTSH